MTLDELRRAVIDSSPDDWHVVEGGPLYPDTFGAVTEYEDGRTEHYLEHGSHYHRASLKRDIAVQVAWGLGSPDDKLTFDWAQAFPDRGTYPSYVDLLWSGALVDRYTGIVVDGGRCTLPFPHAEIDYIRPGEPMLVGEWVTPDELALFRLLHNIGATTPEFDSYFEQAGFKVIDGPPTSLKG